ncbi:MAG TPA: ATP-binding cassette domain-containing protein, partial [Chitinophagaceae bacterium]|nr:ATP-binding cassette domain-containing protein [Chitinophagaceae bacterium]
KMPSELSGGMRKRMGLARTMVVRPEIMLYDEPTTGLDTITSKEISNLILDMQRKYETSSVIITHDIPCARITSDRILIMSHGGFIAEGSCDDLENSKDSFIRSFFK